MKRVFLLLCGLTFLSGCSTALHTDVLPATNAFIEYPPVASQDIEVFESFEALNDKDFTVIGQIDVWGRAKNLMEAVVIKQAAKMGADAVLMLTKFEAHPSVKMLPYRASRTYTGSRDNKAYYLDTYKSSSQVGLYYFRHFAYAIRFDDEFKATGLPAVKTRLTAQNFDLLADLYMKKMIMEKQQNISESPMSDFETKSLSMQKLIRKMDELSFNDLSDFELAAVDAKARMLAGDNYPNEAAYVQKKIKSTQTLANVGALLSFA